MRRIRPLLLALIAVLALVSLRQTAWETACAARGGRYDPATRRCDAASFQAGSAPSFPRRAEVLGGAALVALVGAGVAVFIRRRAIRMRQER